MESVLPVEQLISSFPIIPTALAPNVSAWREKGMHTLDRMRYFVKSGARKGISKYNVQIVVERQGFKGINAQESCL